MACTTDFNSSIDATGNITCKRADTFTMKFQITHEDDDSAYDITAFDKIVIHVKEDAKNANYILLFDSTDGVTFVIESPNIFTLFQDADTMQIPSKGYVYDAEGWSGDVRTTLFGGSFTVVDDVTRDDDTATP